MYISYNINTVYIQVVPVLLGYAGVGTLLALIQLLSIVFACAYSASISRYEKQRDETYQAAGTNLHGNHISAQSTPR